MAILSLQVTTNLEAAILRQLALHLDAVFRKTAFALKVRMHDLIAQAIEDSPEVRSLHGGKLQGELGVIDPQRTIDAIVRALADAVNIEVQTVRAVGRQLSGGMTIGLLRSGLVDLQGVIQEASFISEHGHEIAWLRWLLTEGEQVVIGDYHFAAGGFIQSRTGLGIMVKGGIWHVPAEFAGTIQDNWITRSLITLEQPLFVAIVEEVQRAIAH